MFDSPVTIVLVVFAVYILINKLLQVSAKKARELIEQGAVIVDVRTPQEFAGGSVKDAINMPLDNIADLARKAIPDPEKPILVFCLSGTRSSMARSILFRSGYKNVFNLGSFLRARSIAGQK